MRRPAPAWVPPLRNGVSASRVGVGAGHFPSVLHFLAARFPAVADWPARLARGDVRDSCGQALAADGPCRPGMLLWYWRAPAPEPPQPAEIGLLHQDAHLVVVDKPHGLSVTPGGRHLHQTVLVRLRLQLGIDSLAPMHRLDRDTAGVLVFTVQPATRHAYQALLRDHQVHKVYEAIAPWRADLVLPQVCCHRLEQRPGAAFMQMQVVDGPANAETRMALIARLGAAGGLAHYRLTPRTGRKHQLRVQMSALGLPIIGDRIYPRLLPEPPPGAATDIAQPLQLLARELAFTDPLSGEPRHFISRRRLQLALDGLPTD